MTTSLFHTTDTTEQAVARRVLTLHNRMVAVRIDADGKRTHKVIAAEGVYEGALEIAAIVLGANTPFAVRMAVSDLLQAFPAALPTYGQAFPTDHANAVARFVEQLSNRWTLT